MHTAQLEFSSIEQQQAVFGTQDSYLRIIEKAFTVSAIMRDSVAEIKGENDAMVSRAAKVVQTMQALYNQGEDINRETVYRLIEEAAEDHIDETFQAMKDVVAVTYKGTPIRCKTLGQKNYVKALKDSTVTICIGPAGTGKTYLAVAQAVQELKDGEIDRIIMSRPAIEAGEERLGFLPGDLAQKVDPYLRPLQDALFDMYGGDKVEKLRERGTIEIAPLAYMRGRTLNRARVIIDESQNASLSTLKMALTRLGEGSKMVLTGDVTQIDLPKSVDSGLEKCASILNSIEGISIVRLNNRDVVRNKIVKDIVKAFEKAEEAKNRSHGGTRMNQHNQYGQYGPYRKES